MRGRPGVYVLSVLIAINFLNYLDRYVLAAASSPIQDEFHLSDFQIGLLNTAFLLVYAVAALPFGLWADRGVRRVVIGAGVAFWSVATLFTGLSRSFLQLLLTRGALGVGEASYFPAGTALLGDLFPKGQRGRVIAFRDAGSVFGIAAGYIGGGIIAQRFGWRPAFYFTAAPGLVCAILALTMREPRRGDAEASGPHLARARDATLRALRGLWGIPTLRAVILSQVLLFWVLAALAAFLPLYIHRRYGLGVGAAATAGGGALIAGGLAGTFLGGWLGDRRARRSSRGHLEVGIAGFVLAAAAIVAAVLSPTVGAFLPLTLLAALFLYLYSAPFTALLQNVVMPSLRGSAVTLSLFVAHFFGDSWAPAALGALSDHLHSLSLAILLTCPLALAGAVLAAAWGLRGAQRDTETMEDAWARRRPEAAQAPSPSPVAGA